MWHFDPLGFISVVAYDPKKDKKKDSPFPAIATSADTHVLVRARIKEDLDMLKTVEPTLVVDTDKSADYSFRCVVRRTKFKKFLADSVDRIDYDSHFKEVAEARSPKVQGRHSAMMSCWTAMSRLQPYSPYGGSSWSSGYGDYGDSYWSSTSTTKAASTTKAKSSGKAASAGVTSGSTALYGKEGTASDKRGFDTVEDFIKAYVASGGVLDYINGRGPRHGFKAGDKVFGHFGTGVVTKVDKTPGTGDFIDMVTVKRDKGALTGKYVSSYLMPADLPEIPDEPVIDGAEDPDSHFDAMYTYLIEHNLDPSELDPDQMGAISDDAFELYIRTAEWVIDKGSIGRSDLDTIYDEIKWENASEQERTEMATQGTVPEKYLDDALKLTVFQDATQ